MSTIKVEKKDEQTRLDIFLQSHYPSRSRNYFKKMIEEGKVQVDRQSITKVGYRVKYGEQIEIDEDYKPMRNIDLAPEEMDLDIIEETEDFVAINKPTGIVVHPSLTTPKHTLMNGVIWYLNAKGNKRVGDPIRAGLVHRLDKDTSGVIVISKNEDFLWWLSNEFAARRVKKEYIAIVSGDIVKATDNLGGRLGVSVMDKEIVVRAWMGRNPYNRKKYSILDEGKGKISESRIIVKGVFSYQGEKYSLVKIFPKTGRTHQIRVHLKYLGFPIVGDKVYSGERFERLMLHAFRLTFRYPDDRRVTLVAEIPELFETIYGKKII